MRRCVICLNEHAIWPAEDPCWCDWCFDHLEIVDPERARRFDSNLPARSAVVEDFKTRELYC